MAVFENIGVFFKRFMQNDKKELLAENTTSQSKETAKDRLHVVLMQDRANVSADFLEMMKEEIIEVIKKYIVVDETKIDVRLTNEENEDGSIGVPLLHANIPILNIRNDLKGEYMHNATSTTENSNGLEESNAEQIDNDKTQVIQLIKEADLEVDADTETIEQVQEPENEEVIAVSQLEHTEIDKNEEMIQQTDNIEEPEIVEKEEVTSSITGAEDIKEDSNEVAPKETVVEETSEVVQETVEETEKVQEKQEEKLEDKIDELDDEYEDDDDVTFDDLLKAAEEEEARLKQLEENKEEEKEEKKEKQTNTKKTTTQKKKKTSKTKKNK